MIFPEQFFCAKGFLRNQLPIQCLLIGLLVSGCDSNNAMESPEEDVVVSELVASCEGNASSFGTPQGPLAAMQAVGDSILGWNKEANESIPDVVGQVLGVTMANNAIGGATLRGREGIATQYESGTFSHVLVNGGGNDFGESCSAPTLDAIISSDLQSGLMIDLVNQISREGAQTVIVGYFIPRDRETGCELFPELLQRYRRLAQARSDVIYVCTLSTITPDSPALYFAPNDPIHPSPAGSEAIGRLIADYLQNAM